MDLRRVFRETKVRSDSVALTPVPTTGHTLVMVAQPQVLSINTREAVHVRHQYAIMDNQTGQYRALVGVWGITCQLTGHI